MKYIENVINLIYVKIQKHLMNIILPQVLYYTIEYSKHAKRTE